MKIVDSVSSHNVLVVTDWKYCSNQGDLLCHVEVKVITFDMQVMARVRQKCFSCHTYKHSKSTFYFNMLSCKSTFILYRISTQLKTKLAVVLKINRLFT